LAPVEGLEAKFRRRIGGIGLWPTEIWPVRSELCEGRTESSRGHDMGTIGFPLWEAIDILRPTGSSPRQRRQMTQEVGATKT